MIVNNTENPFKDAKNHVVDKMMQNAKHMYQLQNQTNYIILYCAQFEPFPLVKIQDRI